MIEQRMRKRGVGSKQRKQKTHGECLQCSFHYRAPKTGCPKIFGNKSSMNIQSWIVAPTWVPERLLIGMLASTPSCTDLLTQITPGLIVPDVSPPSARFSAVAN